MKGFITVGARSSVNCSINKSNNVPGQNIKSFPDFGLQFSSFSHRRSCNRVALFCFLRSTDLCSTMSGGKQLVALVTGANKGIGYGIVRGLCHKLKERGIIYLGARNEKLGLEAVKQLEGEGLTAKYIHLDLEDQASVDKAAETIKNNHGGLDILVNNAGFAFKTEAPEPFGEQAEKSVAINYTGTLRVCHAFQPILNANARVVNVSSRAGNVNKVTNSTIKNNLISEDLTLDQLNKIMDDFVSSAKRGSHQDVGFPTTAYGMSKVGLNAATAILQKEVDKSSKKGIIVNACCPGYVDTDMSSHKGTKTIDEGADTPVWLALLPDKNGGNGDSEVPVGKFIAERNVIDWTKGFASIV